MRPGLIIHITDTFPKESETFVREEIREAVQETGIVELWAYRGGVSNQNEEIRSHLFKDISIWKRLSALFRAWIVHPRTLAGISCRIAIHEGWRLPRQLNAVINGVWLWARHHQDPPEALFAHFLYTPATTAWVASRLLKRPYVVFAHAWDLYCGDRLKKIKLEAATEIWTCAKYNQNHLLNEYKSLDRDKIILKYHNVRIQRTMPFIRDFTPPVRIVSVGRLVRKKGFMHLVEACAILKHQGIGFECEIIGEGPEHARLERRIRELNMQNHVRLSGLLNHDAVLDRMSECHVYVQPSVIDKNGDRDVIPNTLREARQLGLPIVTSDITGIPELFEGDDGVCLTEPGSSLVLAEALAAFCRSRLSKGHSGR